MDREEEIEKIAKVMCGGCPDNKECIRGLCADLFAEPVIEFWAHQGGDECLIGFVYDDDICPNCLNPICWGYEKQQYNTGNSIN